MRPGWKAGRDRDLADRTLWWGLTSFSLTAGLAAGAALGFLLFRWPPLLGAIVFGLPCGLLAFGASYALVEGSGKLIGALHAPSGGHRRSGLSREEALIAAGRLEAAAAALAAAHERDPADPRPPRMLAELYRDEVGDLEQSVVWYRRAAAVPGLARESERMLLRELIELTRDRLGRPELAAPALARAAELHEGDRLAHWARQELRAIKDARTP